MRVEMNPFKSVTEVAHPADVTVAVLVHIPFLTGYYTNSLAILELCLASILRNTDRPADLMVFDNGSDRAVVAYLQGLHEKGQIQYLILSDRNIGKNGAWNVIFGAAPGRYIAYSDGDVFFRPCWLSEHLKLFEAFPRVGAVTGFPHRRVPSFCDRSVAKVEADPTIGVEKGQFIPQKWIDEFVASLGKDPRRYRERTADAPDVLIHRDHASAYVAAGHFQFVVPKDVMSPFLPLPSNRPVGFDEHYFDEALDGSGFLRLATCQRFTEHIGNTLTPRWEAEADSLRGTAPTRSRASAMPGNQVLRSRLVRATAIRVFGAAAATCHRVLVYYHR